MFFSNPVTLELKPPAMGIVLRIPYTPTLAATAERPGVQSWALKANSIRGNGQFMVNLFVVF
jgi:hypothetical protein